MLIWTKLVRGILCWTTQYPLPELELLMDHRSDSTQNLPSQLGKTFFFKFISDLAKNTPYPNLSFSYRTLCGGLVCGVYRRIPRGCRLVTGVTADGVWMELGLMCDSFRKNRRVQSKCCCVNETTENSEATTSQVIWNHDGLATEQHRKINLSLSRKLRCCVKVHVVNFE